MSRQVLGSKENTVARENSNRIIQKNILSKTSTKTSLAKKDFNIEQQKLIEKLQKALEKEKMISNVFTIVGKVLNEKVWIF